MRRFFIFLIDKLINFTKQTVSGWRDIGPLKEKAERAREERERREAEEKRQREEQERKEREEQERREAEEKRQQEERERKEREEKEWLAEHKTKHRAGILSYLGLTAVYGVLLWGFGLGSSLWLADGWFLQLLPSQHWHECECGEKDDIGNHNFSEWEQTKDPTFTEAGEKTEKCSVCGTLGTGTEEVPQLALAITAYLDEAQQEGTLAEPIPLKLKLNLGTMGTDTNNWTGLLALLNEKGKYVDLDLSECTITGTEFSTGVFIDNDIPIKPDGMDSIVSIDLPYGITSIGSSAFDTCPNLKSVTIPNSVTSISNAAFWDCTGLTSVTIGNSVETIGASAFSGCTGLTSIDIPDSVTTIGNGAFQDCYSLTSITIGNSVTSIGSGTFQLCYSLTSVTIPDSVTSIGDRAFNRCSSLTSVTFEGTITEANFSTNLTFPGDLRAKYLDATNGGIGTYILSGTTWTKQD